MKTQTNISRPLRVVFFCALVLSFVFMVFNFWEWYVVEHLAETAAYNFGNTDGRAYYYQSGALYAFIHLFWGICFAVSSFLMSLSYIFKAKWYKILSLIPGGILLMVYASHWVVA